MGAWIWMAQMVDMGWVRRVGGLGGAGTGESSTLEEGWYGVHRGRREGGGGVGSVSEE